METQSCRLLVCAATEGELRVCRRDEEPRDGKDDVFFVQGGDTVCAVTGVGIPCTLGLLLPLAQRLRPERILNIGIAGAYPGSGLANGDVVQGDSEVYGDVGFELPDDRRFQPVSEALFGKEFYGEPLPLTVDRAFLTANTEFAVRVARGCTVNCCTGTAATGRLREALFHAGFETMEGAAVAQVGAILNIPVHEIRAISNIAADRDMRPENTARALANLRSFLNIYRGNNP